MVSRIQKLLQIKTLTASRLADEIGVPRSSVSHILNGRNNPSLEFLQKILARYPDVNTEWLIQGKGQVLNSEPDLFNQDSFRKDDAIIGASEINNPTQNTDSEFLFDSQRDKIKENEIHSAKKQIVTQPKTDANESTVFENKILPTSIERIIVFYSDKTFCEYTPGRNIN